MGRSASPLGKAVPARAKKVVIIPMETMARNPPIALSVAHVTHSTAVIRAVSGFVTGKEQMKLNYDRLAGAEASPATKRKLSHGNVKSV